MSLSSHATNRLRELYRIILSRMWTSNARLFESPSRRPFSALAPSLEQLENRLMLSSTLFPAGMQDITTSAYGANSVFAVDLDGDGDMDVLSASEYDDKIAWYENIDSLGTFGPQQVISTSADRARSVFAADLDGDGDVDVLSASFGDDKIAWYENIDDSNAFGPQQVITTLADGARSVFATDLDGDGDMDVLSASYYDHKIAWYENTGGTFGPQQVVGISGGAKSVFAADLDGDGDMDVLSASSIFAGTIAWYENTDGAGEFGPQQLISTLVSGANSAFAADLDGDGDLDVLSASSNDHKIAWYENTGGGTFDPQQVIGTSGGAKSVFAADLDGDGDMDVLSASSIPGDSKIAWYENTGGTFGSEQIITSLAIGANSVFAADLDGDGDMDVLSASETDHRIAWYRNTAAPPTITTLSVTSPIDENGVATLSGTFSDTDGLDEHTVLIDWADGSSETFVLPVGDRAFSRTHQYLDDNPTATASDDYSITVTVSDNTGSDTATETVTVNNVAPAVDAGPDQTVDEGEVVNFNGSFTDPGLQDTHSYLWEFGDGQTATGLAVTHSYVNDGVYAVTLTVTDDDGGVGFSTLTVTVNDSTVLDPLAACEDLYDKVEDLNLPGGVESSLTAKLKPAIHQLGKGVGSKRSLTAMLDNFIRSLTHWNNKGKLTEEAYNELMASAELIRLAILSGI